MNKQETIQDVEFELNRLETEIEQAALGSNAEEVATLQCQFVELETYYNSL